MVRRKRPSKSARDVAAVCAMRGDQARYQGIAPEGLTDELAQVLVDSGSVWAWHLRLLRRGWTRGLMDLQERIFLPGISAHLLVRKRFVEREVRAAREAGAKQLVVLGAGYDLVAARALREAPGMTAIEVDHPPTQARKARAYGRWQGPSPTLVPLDLVNSDLRSTLEAASEFEQGARSVFVAEGLVMYLPPEEVLELMDTFVSLTGPGSRLVISYCNADEQGHALLGKHPRAMRGLARLVGEPLLWATRAEDLPAFVAPTGLRVHLQPTTEQLEQGLLPRRDHPLLHLGAEPFVVLAH